MSPLHTFTNTAELHTVRDWLRYAVSAFNEGNLTFVHGTTSAYTKLRPP